MSSPPHLWSYLSNNPRIVSIMRPEMIPERMSIARSTILSRSAVGFGFRRFRFTGTLNFITSLSFCSVKGVPLNCLYYTALRYKCQELFSIFYTFFQNISKQNSHQSGGCFFVTCRFLPLALAFLYWRSPAE